MKLPEIIGIAGTNGAGKDTLADLRHQRNGARSVSLSDILRNEATKRGLDHSRKVLSSISAEWGREFGPNVLSMKTIEEYRQTKTADENGLSIISIRRPAEAAEIQKQGGVIVWVDADQRTRYDRVASGVRNRFDDAMTFEEFCAEEAREMRHENDDPATLNMAGVRDIADVHIENDFATKEEFENYLITNFEL